MASQVGQRRAEKLSSGGVKNCWHTAGCPLGSFLAVGTLQGTWVQPLLSKSSMPTAPGSTQTLSHSPWSSSPSAQQDPSDPHHFLCSSGSPIAP